MTTPHPKITERRAEVEDQSQRSRQHKLIALAVLFVVMLLAGASTQSALLDVDEIRIVGAERTPANYLRAAAGVELGTPLLGLDTGQIETRLMALPEIETVVASSSWGGVVTVEINERVAVARIESPDGTVVVAADGLVLNVIDRTVETTVTNVVQSQPGQTTEPGETLDGSVTELVPLGPEIAALPEIAGAMFQTERGKSIPDVLDDALTVASVLPADIASITLRVEITVDSLVLRTVGGGNISLGDARDLHEKFEAVRAFLAQVDLSCLETLDVRAPSVPVIRRALDCRVLG
jgi:hypothetical protein